MKGYNETFELEQLNAWLLGVEQRTYKIHKRSEMEECKNSEELQKEITP